MTYSRPKAKAPQTLTANTVGKRKADGNDEAAASKKKLKSHDRTLSMEAARDTLSKSDGKIKAQDKIIRDKGKEIRELKKQVEAAERALSRAKAEKLKIEAANREATEMANSDADLILKKVKSESSWASSGRAEELGRNAVEDMISLGDESDVARLVDMIRDLTNASVLIGALNSVMAGHRENPSPFLTGALRELYLPFLRGTVVASANHDALPLVASAMTISMEHEVNDADWNLLSCVVLNAVEMMKKKNPVSSYGRYDASEDKCPIIDLLLPTYKAIGHETGGKIKTVLWNVIKKALLESVNEVQKAAPNFAMPVEAEIVRKKNLLAKKLNKQFVDFLLSPTETSLSLNLTKAGRMAVHRLIDNNMSFGKLSHQSEGYGHGRFLVIRKKDAEPPALVKKRQERKQQYKDILAKFIYRTLVIELPPQGTRLGMILHRNPEMNMTVLREVAPNSPIQSQIPAEFQNGCLIASLKSDAIGHVQPKTVQDCVSSIAAAQSGAAAPGKLEIVIVPMNDAPTLD